MAGGRTPGPVCQLESFVDVDDGTTSMCAMPTPGAVNFISDPVTTFATRFEGSGLGLDLSVDGAQCAQSNFSLSSKGLDFIERHEGYRNKVYKDSAGNPTIGWGHLIRKGEDFRKGITRGKAVQLLTGDTKTVVAAVNKVVTTKLSQSQFDALVDFTFNLGGRALRKSTLVKNINAGNSVVKENFTDWNHAGGKVVGGLTIRRADEFNLYSKGDYGTS